MSQELYYGRPTTAASGSIFSFILRNFRGILATIGIGLALTAAGSVGYGVASAAGAFGQAFQLFAEFLPIILLAMSFGLMIQLFSSLRQ